MKKNLPSWKQYTAYEWWMETGAQPLTPIPLDAPFAWNPHGVCINPHVIGFITFQWRVGIFTARTPNGRWVAGADITFPNLAAGRLPGLVSLKTGDAYLDETFARIGELQRAALYIECEMNKTRAKGVPITRAYANVALQMISKLIKELNPRTDTRIFNQLTLF